MSKSILDLMQSVGVSQENMPRKENELYNPDIPDDNIEIHDQYNNIYKQTSQPRNGVLSLGNQGQVNKKFRSDQSIDPNIIRAKVDPDTAMPNLNSQSLFSLMPAAAKMPENQVKLVRGSASSDLNYRTRFQTKSVAEEQAQQNSIFKSSADSFKKTMTPARRREFMKIFNKFLDDNLK